MKKHLVLVGGGHAHMVTLANLNVFIEKGFSVTVIGPSPYHYYSGMGPGMLGKTYSPEDIRFATKMVVEKMGGAFVLDKVLRIDPKENTIFLESGDTLFYDVISFNAGSYVPKDTVNTDNGDIFSVKPIESLLAAQQRILELLSEKPVTIGVVGGGPAAVEVAGNIWRLAKDHAGHQPKIIMFAGSRLFSRFPESVRKRVRKSLVRRGIDVFEKTYAKIVETGRIVADNGNTYETELIFLAGGVRPSSIFKSSGLSVGEDGGLKVNNFLQSVDFPNIFGGGDCIYFQSQPLDKVGVYAVRENPILYENLMAALEEKPFKPFNPGGDYLLIFNMGDGTGVLKKKWIEFDGRLGFIVKDYIDRKFMKRFQALEGQ